MSVNSDKLPRMTDTSNFKLPVCSMKLVISAIQTAAGMIQLKGMSLKVI